MPLRILHVVTYMGRGGLETMLMNYYRHMDRSKVQFDFLVHRDYKADYDDEILSLGGRIYHVSRLVPWSKSYKQELKEFYKAHPEYKIVHVHQDCLSSVALQCAKECGIPIRIAHSHNCAQDKNIKYFIKLHYMKSIPAYATELFACGEKAGDWMFRGEQYQLMNNAIDIKKYVYNNETSKSVRRSLGINNEFVIGHVGRFYPQKNHTFLIDIFEAIVKKNSNVKLLLIGEGEGKEAIIKKVYELGLEDKVIFTGMRSDVNELLQAMDVFLFPSLYEGLPVTMIEAQAAGLPCVMSDQISEECIVTNGLVSAENLNESPEIWAEVVLEQREIVRENHSDEIIEAGYDIKSAAYNVQKFYLKKLEDVK